MADFNKDPRMRIIFIDIKCRWESACKIAYDSVRMEQIINPFGPPQFKFKTKILWETIDARNVKDKFPPHNKTACAFVSPANSYGGMDGGIDDIYSAMFPGPPTIEKIVQDCIEEKSIFSNTSTQKGYGFNKTLPVLPIGSGIIVPVPQRSGVISEVDTYLISVPTMVLPRDISNSHNAYYATMAALQVVHKYNRSMDFRNPKIGTIYIPGMCTGCGKMPLKQAARQMMVAIRDFEERGIRPNYEDDSPHSDVYSPAGLHLRHDIDIDMSGHTFTC
uniref:Macro-like domain protein n=1 Tax=Marseillevirus LCMAC101 TaxID=2506602 RepID=A0A481YUD1_9VIRU|nr:MAG: macro-like domain protein [Marseillevirus LCMAC101]